MSETQKVIERVLELGNKPIEELGATQIGEMGRHAFNLAKALKVAIEAMNSHVGNLHSQHDRQELEDALDKIEAIMELG